jgi:hypothetical protein
VRAGVINGALAFLRTKKTNLLSIIGCVLPEIGRNFENSLVNIEKGGQPESSKSLQAQISKTESPITAFRMAGESGYGSERP